MTNEDIYNWAKLVLDHTSLWPIIACAAMIWLSRQQEILKRLTKVTLPGGIQLELDTIKEAIAENKLEIKALENDLERERTVFNEILSGLDPRAPVSELAVTREMLVANARSLQNISIIGEMLAAEATPAQLFAAATTLRERRLTQFFDQLVECLERLAADSKLCNVRLNTVWALTSALHRILIAAIRDGAQPPIKSESLKRAANVLTNLDKNPQVLKDRPDEPDKGIRGPIRLARTWIERGLSSTSL